MPRRFRFEDAAAEHRAAVDTASGAIETQDPARWKEPVAAGKWTPAEIAQHLSLSYAPAIEELGGGAGFPVRLSWLPRTFARAVVMPRILRGRFPRRAPAPRETRPRGGAPDPAAGADALRRSAAEFERRLAEAHAAGSARVTHPYFGRLDAVTILRILAVHAAHHRAQLPPPLP